MLEVGKKYHYRINGWTSPDTMKIVDKCDEGFYYGRYGFDWNVGLFKFTEDGRLVGHTLSACGQGEVSNYRLIIG